MLLDDIKYTSELGFVQDPDYPEVWHIEAHDLARLACCPYPNCKGELTSREGELQSLYIHDYDTRTKNVILITLYRKNYRCTKCKRSCTADSRFNSLKRTDAFDRYVALEALRGSSRGIRIDSKGKEKWSNEVFAQRYRYEKDTISKIVRARAPALTPLFIPFPEYDYFYIHSFKYKSKKRYYLAVSDASGKSMLLGVFGYRDGLAELQTYFELYKDYLPERKDLFILVSYDLELLNTLQEIFGNNAAVIYIEAMRERMEKIKNSLENMQRNKVKSEALIHMLCNRLEKKKATLEFLNGWWELCKEEDAVADYTGIVRKLWPLGKEVTNSPEAFLNAYQRGNLQLSELDAMILSMKKQISMFSQNGPDFTVLAARMMLCSKEQLLHLTGDAFIYTSEIFTSGKEMDYLIKKETDDKGVLKLKIFMDVLKESFNIEDINEIMIDSFWKHYDDEPLENEYEDMEYSPLTEDNLELYTDYSDIPYDSPCFEEAYKQYLYDEEET